MSEKDETTAILALEEQRCHAELANDIPALDRLFDDSFIYVHGSGKVDDKTRLLASRKDLKWLALTRRDLQIHISGDIAVLTGRLDFEVQTVGSSTVDAGVAFATQVLVRRNEQWRFIVHQATRLKG